MKTSLKLIALTLGIFLTFSCDKEIKDDERKYSIAEKQLIIDYPNYKLSNVKWTTEFGYEVARFSAQTKASTPTVTAWYSVTGDKASRQMDAQVLGNTIPDIIKSAFNATVYSNPALWKVDGVELENRYNGNGIEKIYEVELDSRTSNLEAELYFDAKTGELLFSKEDLDDENDDDEDKFVVNQQLIDAVEALYPSAQIVDAEIDNNQIEVEAIIRINNVRREIDLLFSMSYVLIESEIEYKTTYEKLPSEFKEINTWFSTNALFSNPPATAQVEITQGNLFEDDFIPILNYTYGVEIEYEKGVSEYEIIFYLDAKFAILQVKSKID